MIPFDIHNDECRASGLLNRLLVQSGGKPLDIGTAYATLHSGGPPFTMPNKINDTPQS